ncbi:Hha/YmoA family nucleoid-associated regulatory protein [Enterobacter hormaechei]|uniref:Hha/YmoA family nucleoid-associated regulatory protein n=1 Tax=Enterobacter hormaechei TaxID=158836 RepID=UPI0039C33F1A
MTDGKMVFLMKFRKCACFDTLERMFERFKDKHTGSELDYVYSAYDHRKAELTTNKLYDKVPASVWALITE